jgi:phosphatidate phosphatase APP1
MHNLLKQRFSDLLNKVVHDGDVEVTIYPAYGFLQGTEWVIPLRGWVHQNRRLPDHWINELAQAIINCSDDELGNFGARFDGFSDDSRSNQTVTIQLDGDDERSTFQSSDLNGLIEMTVKLRADKAQALAAQQNSTDGWLSFNVVSEGHRGKGRVNLVGPRGLSVVSDIDDTIKVTEVPAGKDVVLKNTFCRPFIALSDMVERYRALGGAAFHYVSGGPCQLYQPLAEFLTSAGFPPGTLHLNYFPKNFLSEDTRSLMIDSICGSLSRTYDHKVEQITRLLERFPEREFILVGDSGELDVEVYRRIRELFGARVREIWIRDVINDKAVNEYRLEGVDTIIKPEKIVCATEAHHEKLAVALQRQYQRPYAKNNKPPCGAGV